MKFLFFFLVLFLLPLKSWCEAPNFSRRFGLSVAAGRSKPILSNKFDDRADGEFVSGFYGRYQINRTSGLQLGYTRYEWAHSPTAARVYDLLYLHRLASRKWFTPIWGAGAGLVDIANYNVDENLKLGLRARVGMEFALSNFIILDLVVDYQFVNRMIGEEDNLKCGEIHALAPQILMTYFFK